MNKKLIKYDDYLTKWAYKKQIQAKANAFILGLSGGIDSALVLALLTKDSTKKIYGVFIDIYNAQLDKKCIEELRTKYNFEYIYLNLEKEFEMMRLNLKVSDINAINNLKVRLRMISLYALAAEYNALVVGTTNADERLTGYFTKFGDSACDISLLDKLIKSQINQLAKYHNVPNIIVERLPSASLYEGQSDETDLGLTYNEIDNYILCKKISIYTKNKISDLSKKNKHKLQKISSPKKFSFFRRR